MTKFWTVIGISGAVTAIFLLVLWRLGVPIGHLPGDIRSEGEHHYFSFPIVTCLLASVIFTLVANIVARFFR